MLVEVRVRLKSEVLDPQGEAIRRVLGGLGFAEVRGVRVGKLVMLEIEGDDPNRARRRAEEACRELLANPVIEEFEVRIP